jgi:hypothetical protein
MKTTKDYIKKNAPITWAVITNKGIVMECDFLNKNDAEDFKNNAYNGYYKECKVICIEKRNTTRIETIYI